MEQSPAEQPDFVAQYFRIRSEVLQTMNPLHRLELMEAAIIEGDRSMAVHAFETLQGMPDVHPDIPDKFNQEKFVHSILLTEALVKAGMTQEAERLVEYVCPLDFQLGVEAIDAILWCGHTGPGNSYLSLAPEMMGRADIPARTKLQYTAHLAAYGQNIFDPKTDAHKLLENCLPPNALQHEIDRNLFRICSAYTATSQFKHAEACVAAMRDPYWEKEATLTIARDAQKGERADLADRWLASGTDLTRVANCNPLCGRPSCNPAADVQALNARAAVVYAMRGDFVTALRLIDEADLLTTPERREVYIAHYEQTGNMASREAAISAITAVTDLAVTSQVERLFHADIAWGNTLPSLEDDSETVPQICWELHEMYNRLSETEQRLQGPEGELKRTILEHFFRVPISDFLAENAASRADLRDRLLTEMIKHMAPDASHTAYALLQLVESRVERVRALIAVGRQHGYEGFYKLEQSEPVAQDAEELEKKGGMLGSTSDMVLNALRRLIETFRHPPK